MVGIDHRAISKCQMQVRFRRVCIAKLEVALGCYSTADQFSLLPLDAL